ncbi:AraC family transcriptional regulator of adaptative response / DNA-3-methyladenine glycosylase II [Paucibacter oligotrophus]|uniref:DNA-3-methyladenine glycosylase II n=1 Tax=Roseateles oligotrophus TaxID=1769250 RepID=A0A840L3Y3_9BURK|nr:AlkA N-terminal domain-containing protein [Roseateles oligotrophus]MBB4841563.1 AraC family transcriptional regulator of adaptative response / DNA-3-methyladenine glycosylase II [Roseateles oligotrophus]
MPDAIWGFRLAYRPPYQVEAMLQFLADRAIADIESVDLPRLQISRSLAGPLAPGWVQVRFDPGQARLEVLCSASLASQQAQLSGLLSGWLDLQAEPSRISQALGGLALPFPGLRLPGCVDRFELAVRAVLGQQITVAAARTLAGRFVQAFGPRLEGELPPGLERPLRLFPSPQRIADLQPGQIAELGIIRRRADCLLALARAWPHLRYARQSLDGLAAAEQAAHIEAAMAELRAIPGIGPWTAHYMLMRGWSWPDAFPPSDVVLLKQLSLGLDKPLSPKAYLAAAEAFRPFRSYAVLSLWRAASLAQAKARIGSPID